MRFAPFFGEFAFDGGFEDGGFVALEIGLDALQVGDRFVETGELFFDLRDDLFCCSGGGMGMRISFTILVLRLT